MRKLSSCNPARCQHISVYGQIHAPALYPIMFFCTSWIVFLATLWSSKPSLFLFLVTWRLRSTSSTHSPSLFLYAMTIWQSSWKSLAKTHAHARTWCVRSHNILYKKGLCANCLYMIKCIYDVGSRANLDFSSVSGPLLNEGLKRKINRMHNRPHWINIDNCWLPCEVTIFP
jgi:hypothetical protein